MLSAPDYLLGILQLGLIAAGAYTGGEALRRRLLPGWSGPPAWLATSVLAIGLTVVVAQLLGTVGRFDDIPFTLGMVLAGAGLHLRMRGSDPVDAPGCSALAAPPVGRWQGLAALAVVAVVVAHFSIETRVSLAEGMSGFDSTWYHAPFAALFAAEGSTWDLNFIAPQYLSWFYPQNSELLHAVGILALDRDVLSPLFSLAWLGGCLASTWCIGRPFGAGPASMAGAALVLGAGVLADQSGEARNDMPAIFFLLAAVAVFLNAWAARGGKDRGGEELPVGALAVVGVAVGLAAGTKVNYLAPAVALAVGVALIAPRGSRARALGAVSLPALAGGGYWYLRNLIHAGNPLPWLKEAGPVALPSPDQPLGGREEHGVADYLTDTGVWGNWFGPGFHEALGFLWPVIALLAAGAVVLCLGRRAGPALRVVAGVIAVTVGAWLAAPASAEGPLGMPVGFVSGLRYLAPALAIALAILPLAPRLRSARAGLCLLAGALLILPFADASSESWPGAYLPVALAAGLVTAAGAYALGREGRRRLRGPSGARVAILLTILAVLAAGAGYALQRSYLNQRYLEPTFADAGLNAAFRWARDVSDSGIATNATRQYPFFGTDLSNEVEFVGTERPNGGFVRIADCREWRRALNDGGYDYVVTSLDRSASSGPRYPREAAWTAGDPAATEVLRREPTVVFRLSGPLSPERCPE